MLTNKDLWTEIWWQKVHC